MTTLSQYLDAEDPDWSEPDSFNLAHADRDDAPYGLKLAAGGVSPGFASMALARDRANAKRTAEALRKARAREERALAASLADPLEGVAA